MIDKITVKIVAKDHPHCGKIGHIKINENDTVTVVDVGGLDMFTVNFEDGISRMACHADCVKVKAARWKGTLND